MVFLARYAALMDALGSRVVVYWAFSAISASSQGLRLFAGLIWYACEAT
jgi:hypothetical protein